MGRRLGALAGTTGILLAATIVAAAPAEARRNVGGTVPEGSVCVYPGNGTPRSAQAAAVVPCICIVVPGVDGARRNVGGTGPSGGSCPPGLTKTTP